MLRHEILRLTSLLDLIANESIQTETERVKIAPPRHAAQAWNQEAVEKLADSILREYPIGMLVTWCEESAPTRILIEGARRATSLAGSFGEGPGRDSSIDWALAVNLDTGEVARECTLGTAPAMRLDALRDTGAFYDALRRATAGASETARHARRERAEHAAGMVRDYPVAITHVIGTKLADAVEIATRLNG